MNKAICSKCNADVLKQLEVEFNEICANGPPNSVYFNCSDCDMILLFKVEVCYAMCGFESVPPTIENGLLPNHLTDDYINYEPSPSGDKFDYNIVLDFVTMFSHILPDVIVNNNMLDTILYNSNKYYTRDMFSDSEASCSYWYFKYREDALYFIKQLNKWLDTLKET